MTKYYKPFYEIDEEFEFNNKSPRIKIWLRVQKSYEGCTNCFFRENGCSRPHLLPSCLAMMRKDNKPIKYIRVKEEKR